MLTLKQWLEAKPCFNSSVKTGCSNTCLNLNYTQPRLLFVFICFHANPTLNHNNRLCHYNERMVLMSLWLCAYLKNIKIHTPTMINTHVCVCALVSSWPRPRTSAEDSVSFMPAESPRDFGWTKSSPGSEKAVNTMTTSELLHAAANSSAWINLIMQI